MRKLYLILTLILPLLFGAVVLFPARAQTTLGPGFYNEDFFLLDYQGTGWLFGAEGVFITCMDMDTRATTTTALDSVQFSMWGDGFTLYTSAATGSVTNGIDLCIDSMGCFFTSTYNGGVNAALEFSWFGLGYGEHDISIVHNTGRLNICGILVHPPAPQPTLEPLEILVTVEISTDDLQFPTQIPPVPVGEPAYRTYFEVPSSGDDPQFLAVDNIITPTDVVMLLILLGIFMLVLRGLVRRRARD